MPNGYSNCNSNCPYNFSSLNNANLSNNKNYIFNKKNSGPLSMIDNKKQILIIFEAPGIDEWSKNEPLSSKRLGSAAKKFKDALATAGKNINNYDIAEAVYCFPGKSGKGQGQKIQTELDLAATFCETHLASEILSKNYTKIVCFCKVAYDSVTRIIQKLVLHPHYNATYLATNVIYHPHPMACSFSNLVANIKKDL